MEEQAPSLEAYLSQETFHRINVAFPGVRLLHERPYIFAVDDFATAEECLALIRLFNDENAQPSATAPCQEELRTSSSVFPSLDAILWLRQRIAAATNVTDAQLEPTKISRYLCGEYFRKHTDASFLNEKLWAFAARLAGVDDEGVQEPCGWPSRFCTLFLYLSDSQEGGRTRFRWLDGAAFRPLDAQRSLDGAASEPLTGGAEAAAARAQRELSLTPRAGTAVIHFPTTSLASGCVPDPRTMHESEPAGEATKYILQQFIWPVPIEPAGGRMHEDVRREWAGVLRAAEPPADQSEPAAADQSKPPTDQSDLPAATRSDPFVKQSELDLPPRPDACSLADSAPGAANAERLASAAGVRVCEQTAPGWVGQCGAIERSSFVRSEAMDIPDELRGGARLLCAAPRSPWVGPSLGRSCYPDTRVGAIVGATVNG
ncbi:hypothetical protein EMIHUDRAFT_453825 [Emiliania huxleyi CCMP1516]|uniref:Prolyl 4-hydroxylase alpha subunit domain-containing protein n=2 Tax=Emiliania huxleyi TaxID=2903 RepID=A0A0D3HZP6_EMIH1|nr:hypothetical protein EMIHUDRAFT_453825 [Emiliania huxleyi CCMP1516]EOD04481.1 hypothetical protein EMIHUDRAFT_453825 [Emiliania huxleyi CCMP1516]|eukprot:XP_005756910.1 hypothetical protein EMIHUDRAFT_453825 [Emiliania huxleyi CCMP1516]